MRAAHSVAYSRLAVVMLATGSALPGGAGEVPGSASDEPSPETPVVELEEVTVTGSRVRRKDLVSPAPLLIFGRESIEASGRVTIGDFLQALPEQANAANGQWNAGGDGSLRLALRGLGDHRTLVLLNGRRMVAGGGGANSSVDLGSIPSAVVERIEILKDGASPLYGSDAIGGVVNIITRRGWNGTEASAFFGTSSRRDGSRYYVSATTGQASDSGSIFFSAGYQAQQAIAAASRGWSSSWWNDDLTGAHSPLGVPGPYAVGDPYGAGGAGRIYTVGVPGIPLPDPGGDPKIALYNRLVTAYPTATSFVPDASYPDGWRPWRGEALPRSGGDQYNALADSYLVTPTQRLSLFTAGDLRLASQVRCFFEASFVSRSSQQRISPEVVDLGFYGLTLSAANRYNPFGVDIAGGSRTLVALGPRTNRQDVDTVNLVAGVDGKLPAATGPLRGWSWDASLAFGRTQGTERTSGTVNLPALAAALGPSFDYGTEDHPDYGCGTGPGDRVRGCVPLDLFGAISPDQVAGLLHAGLSRGTNQLTTFQANSRGDLLELPSGHPARLAVGGELRWATGSVTPDAMVLAGQVTGTGSTLGVEGVQSVREAYAELSLPLAAGLPYAEVLEAQAAARLFRYDGFGTDWTWKLGARWKPVQDVTLRGTLSTAFRAPIVAELHSAKAGWPASFSDPCASSGPAGTPQTPSPWCGAAAGVVYPSVPFLDVTFGGNPRLEPEVARIFTVGLVIEPRFVPGLSVAVDLYGVAIDRSIQPLFLDPTGMLQLCYPTSTVQAPRFCDHVERDPVTQRVTSFNYYPVNAGNERMTGVDLSARYAVSTPAGRLGLAFDGTWLARYDLVLAEGGVLNLKGKHDSLGVGAMYPAFKFNAAATWRLGGLAAGVDVRFLGSMRECADQTGLFGRVVAPDFSINGSVICSWPYPTPEHVVTYQRHIRSYSELGLRVSQDIATSAGLTSILLGVSNVLDVAPPRIYGGTYSNAAVSGWNASDPAYDFTGRLFYLRLIHRL